MADEISEDERQALARKGWALPDGSYYIRNCQDLHNAVSAYGRAPESHRPALARLIRKRHGELGGCGITLEALND